SEVSRSYPKWNLPELDHQGVNLFRYFLLTIGCCPSVTHCTLAEEEGLLSSAAPHAYADWGAGARAREGEDEEYNSGREVK
ncbi:hypothetical protein KUCAC02_016061, partial [Chaenocephalus aceratus]